jgi:hypothetical protein
MFTVNQGASEPNASILTHIMIDGYNATELFDASLHLVKQEEQIIRITIEQQIMPVIVDCKAPVDKRKPQSNLIKYLSSISRQGPESAVQSQSISSCYILLSSKVTPHEP